MKDKRVRELTKKYEKYGKEYETAKNLVKQMKEKVRGKDTEIEKLKLEL